MRIRFSPLLLGCFALWVLLIAGFSLASRMSAGGDLYRHLAIVDSFQKNLLFPEHEAIANSSAYRELHTPFHFAVALISRCWNTSALEALRIFATLDLALFAVSSILFFAFFLHSWERGCLASLAYLLSSLTFRFGATSGGAPVSIAGVMWAASYPAFCALGFVPFVPCLVDRWLRHPQNLELVLTGLLVALITLVYPPWAPALLLWVAFQGIFYSRERKKRLTRRQIGGLVGMFGGAFLLCAIWPYYRVFAWGGQIVTQLTEEGNFFRQSFAMTIGVLGISGPAVFFCWKRRIHGALAATALSLFVGAAAALPIGMPFFARFMTFSGQLLFLLLTLFFFDGTFRADLRLRWLVAALLVGGALVSPQTHSDARKFGHLVKSALRYGPRAYDHALLQKMEMLRRNLTPRDVVLLSCFDSGETYRLPAFTGAKLTYARYAHIHPQREERRNDLMLFFRQGTATDRQKIIEKYSASAIVICRQDLRDGSLDERVLQELGEPTDMDGLHLFYRLRERDY